VMHMWMATLDGGLAATLYGPSSVVSTVHRSVQVSIEEATAYPFVDSIELKLYPEKDVQFPLYLRIPVWCRKPESR